MKPGIIRIFRAGRDTCCEWRFDAGVGRGRILKPGSGVFIDPRFKSLLDAREFCEKELERDNSLILYMMDGDDIVDTVMDVAFHEAEQKRSGLIYAIISSTIIAAAAFGISIGLIRFESTYGHIAFVAGMTMLYILMLWTMGTGNIDSAVAMIMILVLTALLVTQIRKHHEPKNSLNPVSDTLPAQPPPPD